MIILDTNVLSELMRQRPDARVLAWANSQSRRHLVSTVITALELHSGLLLMPPGARREELRGNIDWAFESLLGGRVLSFDQRAAIASAEIYAKRKSAGRGIDLRDTQIAGIAVARRIPVATRNVLHFDDLDVKIVNPWS